MCLATLFNLGGGEVILIVALILIFISGKKLPELAAGLRQGISEFMKATREIAENLVEKFNGERFPRRLSHALLIALTFILGSVCLILVVYEFSK